MSKRGKGEDLEDLLDERKISKARGAAEEKHRDVSLDDLKYLRKRAKTDLYFLCQGPLEYTRFVPHVHGHLAGWIERNRGYQHRMELLPRDHYKSTQITIGDGIQMALPNDAGLVEMPYALGPNVKILLGHEVREMASKFLFEIAAAFTRKEGMLALFPDCIPSKRTQRVNKWELELPRSQHHKEATFSTIGAGGAAQGGHYNWCKLDDLVGEDARDSKIVMKRALDWFDNVNALLDRIRYDGWDLTGTRWSYADVYSHAMERYGIDVENSILNCIPEKDIEKLKGGLLRIYARGAIENGKPIFPEEFPAEKLLVLRKNPLVWAAQYANNPLESGLNEFTWPLKYYNVDPQGNLVVFSGESSYKRYLHQLDVCVLCDPSMGESSTADHSGIVVTGMDEEHNIYILETIKKQLRPNEFIDELFRLHMKYQPRIVAIEEVNFSGIYKYWIEERAKETRVHLPIRSYKPGSKRSKEGRIRGLAHFFSAGQVFIVEGMHELRDEYEQFPMTRSQHLLDALAQGPEYWLAPKSGKAQDVESEKQSVDAMLDGRSSLTGY